MNVTTVMRSSDPLLQPYQLKHLTLQEPDHVDGA